MPTPPLPRVDHVAFDGDSIRRVLVAGDTHGNPRWLKTLCKLAKRFGIRVVLVVGDFGHWPGDNFAERVSKYAEQYGVFVVFIDGNHDWHDDLRARPVDDDGFVTIAPRVRWVPRGHRWRWGGRRFGAIGGALSTDRHGNPAAGVKPRKQGVDWWAEETPTDADVETLGAGALDVLFTHDAPTSSPLTGERGHLNAEDEITNGEVRDRLERAMRATRPATLIHGHWHWRYTHDAAWIDAGASEGAGEIVWQHTRIEGLGGVDDEYHAALALSGLRNEQTWGVLDLEDVTFSDGIVVVAARNTAKAAERARET